MGGLALSQTWVVKNPNKKQINSFCQIGNLHIKKSQFENPFFKNLKLRIQNERNKKNKNLNKKDLLFENLYFDNLKE